MIDFHAPFSGFSVDDPATAQAFYGNVLGLDVEDAGAGMFRIGLGGGHHVLVCPKGARHVPATSTVLNLPIDDVSTAVHELAALGAEFARYDGMPQDGHGVMKGNGPDIAWFTYPAGNVLSIVAA